jgi:hypothetical protein
MVPNGLEYNLSEPNKNIIISFILLDFFLQQSDNNQEVISRLIGYGSIAPALHNQ